MSPCASIAPTHQLGKPPVKACAGFDPQLGRKSYLWRVSNRRWPWWVASACLLGAGIAAGAATYQYWRPCEGSLLVGTILQPFSPQKDFSDACLRRMDGGTPFPMPEVAERAFGVVELVVVATVLAALAWLILVLGLRWSWKTKVVAVVPGLATGVLAATTGPAIVDAGGLPSESVFWLGMAGDLTAVVALMAIWAWEPDVRGVGFARVVIVLWGTTSLGFSHMAADFLIMATLSVANWDVPPGTGWLTVAGLTASAVVTAVLTLSSGSGEAQTLRGHAEPGLLESRTEVR
jgi:hypothetical protein